MESKTEPRHKRLERLRAFIDAASSDLVALTTEDARFLIDALEERDQQIRATHGAVDDAARRWRKIGYEDGYAAGYDDALRGLEE